MIHYAFTKAGISTRATEYGSINRLAMYLPPQFASTPDVVSGSPFEIANISDWGVSQTLPFQLSYGKDSMAILRLPCHSLLTQHGLVMMVN